jgi:hypothetical protein
MFWKAVDSVVRASVAVHRAAAAIGAAMVITVAVYDYVKSRKRERPL